MNRLSKGDLIGIVSPSHIASRERHERIISVIESLGFRVIIGENVYKDTYGYLASEQERADDFNSMAANAEVKMILFGGGEGGNELLPHLNYESLKNNPKLICGFSDGTTILNAIHAKTGLVTYYGQGPGMFFDLRHYDYTHFAAHFIEGYSQAYQQDSPWKILNPGTCEGRLTGGYLRNFALLLGSDYFNYDHAAKYILFLEDYEKFSNVAKVSSFISHIEQNPFINNVAGLIWGHYANAVPDELLQRLARFGKRTHIPVVYCDDFGHGTSHAILPIGVDAALNTYNNSLAFLNE